MKTLTEYLTDFKTTTLLHRELTTILKNFPQHENDYLFFYGGRLLSNDKRSKSYKWKKYYQESGYIVTGERLILRRAVEISGYEHSKYAGLIFLRNG